MSVTLSYQAIPPTSSFYKRLQHEQTLNILLVSLFLQGNSIFNFFDINNLSTVDSIRSINDDLERIIKRHHEIFGSELEASLAVAEYRSELMLTCRAYPGIENRRYSLGAFPEIEEGLSCELSRRKFVDVDSIVERIMFGDRRFAPAMLIEGEESLGLISREIVSEGASILRQIDLDNMVEVDANNWDEYLQWMDFYLEADKKGEELLIAVI
jgi:hypothetical protein